MSGVVHSSIFDRPDDPDPGEALALICDGDGCGVRYPISVKVGRYPRMICGYCLHKLLEPARIAQRARQARANERRCARVLRRSATGMPALQPVAGQSAQGALL